MELIEKVLVKMKIKTDLDQLIDDVVIELNQPLLDDDYPDTLGDMDKREEAIDWIINRLEQIKAGEI